MRKIVKLIMLVSLASCSAIKNGVYHRSTVAEKPPLEFQSDKLSKPNIITEDKCYLINSPKTPVVCMLPSEYEKDVRNYGIMLDILKRYQISDSYYRP